MNKSSQLRIHNCASTVCRSKLCISHDVVPYSCFEVGPHLFNIFCLEMGHYTKYDI